MSAFSTPPKLFGVQSVLWTLPNANFAVTTDQALTQAFPFATYTIDKIVVTNATGAFVLAAGGFYTGAGKTGITIVAAGQVYTGLTGSLSIVNPVLASGNLQSSQSLYFALSVANGTAASANIYVTGYALS